VEVKPTIAEGTAIRRPIRMPEILSAIRQSGGGTVAVPEDLIVAAINKLGELGLYAEPTSATAAAALDTLHETGVIHPRETTVVLLTGSGLKSTALMTTLFAS
jgi:threonine synthase